MVLCVGADKAPSPERYNFNRMCEANLELI